MRLKKAVIHLKENFRFQPLRIQIPDDSCFFACSLFRREGLNCQTKRVLSHYSGVLLHRLFIHIYIPHFISVLTTNVCVNFYSDLENVLESAIFCQISIIINFNLVHVTSVYCSCRLCTVEEEISELNQISE